MGTLESCPLPPLVQFGGSKWPLIVVGVTHPQTCLILRGRLRAMHAAGFRVVLISSPGELITRIAAEEGVKHCAIPMRRGISPLADLISLLRLCSVLRRLRPAIAEFSTPKAGLLGSIAGFLCGVSVRVYILRGLRLETASGMKRRILRLTERVAAACSHLVVCNSESLRSRAHSLGIAPQRKLWVIGDGSSAGVDTRRFAPRTESTVDEVRAGFGIPGNEPVIGFVGRLTHDKGVPVLLRAFEEVLENFPQAWLLLVGWFDESEDALNAEDRARIETHPRILCTGFVSETAPYYRAMDLLVLPTWREGFPNAVLEAAASGVPVVSTLVTGARDAVRHNRTGLLVPPGDARVLTLAIERLLLDPVLRRKMGVAGRDWVTERFVYTRIHRRTIGLYRKLIHNLGRQSTPSTSKDAVVAGD
ncbi:MAG TPA: glycosyltransferase family 4 protein [Terracidiphilus sp.]|nr:glycosyltransferase family 4 protein [Terracidiphilus sp.]